MRIRASVCDSSRDHLVVAIFLVVSAAFSCTTAFQPISLFSTRCHSKVASSDQDPSDTTTDSVVIAVTREDGKNGKLLKALEDNSGTLSNIQMVELPCIAHADGPDLGRLRDCLVNESWDYVAVTSPEAARVLASCWDAEQMSQSDIQVAAVGKATQKVLQERQISVAFTPSKAYAKTLVAELPGSAGTRLLYPASCRAPGTLANGLTERGFHVQRLNTYDTVTAEWTRAQKELSQQCQVVCFASPSSIKGWLQNSNGNNHSVMAACIGETSASACRDLGWPEGRVFRPDSPGIDGWVEAIREAVQELNAQQQNHALA